MQKVKQISLKNKTSLRELTKEFSELGVFGAGRIGKASDIMYQMAKDKECKIFLGIAGPMVPGGMKNIIIDTLKTLKVSVFVTTGATLTHDLIEALGYSHFQGSKDVDDSKLLKKGIDRIYESFMPNAAYEKLEDFFIKFSKKYNNKELNIKEFLWLVGSEIKDENSILYTCYKNKIPIFCPAISDSGIGLMIWGRLCAGMKLKVDTFDDLKEIIDISWTAKKKGIIYVGGGVPKNYIQQSLQFSGKGADYGIQITTSSGAELREGISWGKMNSQGKFVDVICDATIALPIILGSVKEKLNQN